MQALKQACSDSAPAPVYQNSGFEGTIGQEIGRLAELRPNHPAMVSPGFSPLSYRDLQCLIREIRATLRLAGFSRSSRIAIALSDSKQAALAINVVACSAVSIPLGPNLTGSEIESSFKAVRPNAVLVVQGSDSAARRVATENNIKIIEAIPPKDGVFSFAIVDPTPRVAESNEADEPEPDAPAFILQTSGTTGEPKLIPFSHRNMLAVADRSRLWFNLTPEDRCLCVAPVFYAHGLKVAILTPLLTGGTVVFPTNASKFDYADWFGRLKPTWYSAGPATHRLVLDQTQDLADARTGHSLRFVLSSSAPLPLNVLEGLQDRLGVRLIEHYSSSEASLMAANLPPPAPSKPGSLGAPWADSLIIAAAEGRQLLPNEQGEILVRGPTVISGYLDAPDLNSRAFRDGWFRTGDIGSLDENGILTLHGRVSDLINRGGEKISPVEIDQLLLRHPAVAEAAAFSVPHPRLGEDVAAAVVLRPGAEVTPFALRRYLRHKLTSFKVPRRIIVRDHLPKGKTGKVLRRVLTASFAEAAAETQTTNDQFFDSPMDVNLAIQLTELWERLLNTAPIGLDDDFLEKGGDSLLAIVMLAELEKLTGDTIPNTVLFEASTIRQLAHTLSGKGKLKSRPLIKLNSNGNRTPLVFFHNDYRGGGIYTLELATLLGSDQPLYVVAPHGADHEPIPPSIEAMARDRLELIMDAQPEGPYRLCGYCASGLVAFEVARMLIAAGKEVETVGMIDPPTVNARRSVQSFFSMMNLVRPVADPLVERTQRWTFRILALFDKFRNLPATRRWAFLRDTTRKHFSGDVDQLHSAPKGASGPSAGDPGWILPERLPDDERNPKYARAVWSYIPAPLAVHVIYFAVEYSLGAWERISPNPEVIRLPGGHGDVDIPALADHLRSRLHAE
jgi:acyl-CoA synthetase (AMP-forming)/AMP-acid ligase II